MLLDFTGGSLSILQMFLLSYNYSELQVECVVYVRVHARVCVHVCDSRFLPRIEKVMLIFGNSQRMKKSLKFLVSLILINSCCYGC